jgi:DNA-binding beta-propeller fold protein YncE
LTRRLCSLLGLVAATATVAAFVTDSTAARTRDTRLPRGVTASIRLGAGVAPLAVLSAYGSIWVSTHRATDLYRIDPKTNRIVATIDVGQVSCGLSGSGFGQIWVTPCQDTWTLVRVDARRNRVVGRLHPASLAIAFGAGSAWFSRQTFGPGVIERVGPNGHVTVRIRAGSGPATVTFGGGRLWNVNGDDGTLDEINPANNRVVATVPFVPPQSYGYLLYFANRLWFSGGIAGAPGTWIAEYDPKSGKTSTLHIRGSALSQFGDQPAVSGLGSLWVRTSNRTVSRIDPRTGRVRATYPADPDGGGGFAAVADGSLWVANFASDSVWRVRIKR